jgi:hypothetical protein
MTTVWGQLYRITVEILPASIKGCEECLKYRQPLDSPANVHEQWEGRLLRLVAQPSRLPVRTFEEPPGRTLRRAGRGLELVVRRRGHIRLVRDVFPCWAGPDIVACAR